MAFAPVPAKEYAVVWEMRPEEARGALFELGADQRITLRRTWQAVRGAPLPSFLKLKQFHRAPVVVSLHPALARTFILPFRLARKKGEAPIPPAHFQTMLQEFLSKTRFEMRRLAGDALGCEELDTILLDARLMRLVVDGEEVREDARIEGRRVEGFLEVIFTTRAAFHDLHNLLHSGRETFFTERGPAALAFLSRHIAGPLAFLDLDARGGWLFRMDHDAEEIVKKSAFKWDADDLPAALSEAWGLSRAAAEAAYRVFLKDGFSEAAARTARKLMAPIEESFDRAVARAKLPASTYVRAAVPLPFTLPAARSGAELLPLPLATLLDASGVEFVRGAGTRGEAEDSYYLLPLLEYYYHRGDPGAHKALTRHIHWIAS